MLKWPLSSKRLTKALPRCLAMNPDADLATNQSEMTAQLPNVVSGSITQAIRDTTINGLAIKTTTGWVSLTERSV